jgi:hypothetical protein
MAGISVQGIDDGPVVLRSERRDEDRGDLQIGRHPDFRNRDHRRLDDVVTHVSALEHFGQRMAYLLADAKHSLRGTGCGVGSGHGNRPLAAGP